MPKFALARGLWLGEIPDELQQLSFAEKLLIGRVMHNQYVVCVAKGMHKMIANAVAFEYPMQKIYTVLPPPIEEMDELLAFIHSSFLSLAIINFRHPYAELEYETTGVQVCINITTNSASYLLHQQITQFLVKFYKTFIRVIKFENL
jgi:hypothetical protein